MPEQYKAEGKEILTTTPAMHVADAATPELARLIASLLNSHADTQRHLSRSMGDKPAPDAVALYVPPPRSTRAIDQENVARRLATADQRRAEMCGELDRVRDALDRCESERAGLAPGSAAHMGVAIDRTHNAVEGLLAVVSRIVRECV